MTSPVSSSHSFDHLVYLRVFEGCNLACDHCFIPNNPKRMGLDLIERTGELLGGKVPDGSAVHVQWHGGEPTMFGPAFIAEGLRRLEAAAPHYRWSHGIQTNLMSYNDHPENRAAWRTLYHDHFGGEVGVSWDPVIRRMRGGDPADGNARFEAVFWPALHALVEDGIQPYVVVTATKVLFESIQDPMAWWDRWVEAGVRKMHLERVTRTGEARDAWDRLGLDNAAYDQHMLRWFKMYTLWRDRRQAQNLPVLFLSPFEGFDESVARLNGWPDPFRNDRPALPLNPEARGEGSGCWSGACDTRFHTIDAHGYKHGCTALTSEVDNKASAVSVNTVQWFRKGTTGQALRSVREERQRSCDGCAFLPVCSSGCLSVEKFDATGACSGGKPLFEWAQRAGERRLATLAPLSQVT